MKKQLLSVVLGLAVIAAGTFAMADDVYVTKRGKHYHQAVCKVLKNKESLKITTEDAEGKSLTPCKVCFKDQANSSEKE